MVSQRSQTNDEDDDDATPSGTSQTSSTTTPSLCTDVAADGPADKPEATQSIMADRKSVLAADGPADKSEATQSTVADRKSGKEFSATVNDDIQPQPPTPHLQPRPTKTCTCACASSQPINKKPAALRMLQGLWEARSEAALQSVEANHKPEWESTEVIIDSGAHVSVGPPKQGKKAGYAVQESPGSRAGVCYTAAGGGELPNLGQRLMAVLTEEGTIKGMHQQVADVIKPLEAVRANVKANHAVIFDDDGTGRGLGSYMINKTTGEMNIIRDNGSDYIMRRWIIPEPEVPSAMSQRAMGVDQDFGRPSH